MANTKERTNEMKNTLEEGGHNYPFDVSQSPFSRFEEKTFPKLLLFGSIIAVVILFALLAYMYNFETALLFTFIFILILGFIDSLIVKLMIRRREKKRGFK